MNFVVGKHPSVLESPPLVHLPLEALHLAESARMAAFAGYSMPIHYPLGILGEHRHTRAAAGLFDVSHMGQIRLRPRSGRLLDAARALERLVPVDVISLRPGRQRYAMFTSSSGGILDDLMVANLDSYLHLIVNASRVDTDLAHLHEHLSAECEIEWLSDHALLALQGPEACAVLDALLSVNAMRFMDVAVSSIEGVPCVVSRSGYTGEDGFEISLPAVDVMRVAESLLRHPSVRLVGLGARDSLRLEAGLCLYGHELSESITPVEAALEWAVQSVRRSGGARAGGFLGAETILAQWTSGASRRRVGLTSSSRPVREGAELYADTISRTPIGVVTSGTHSPTRGCAIAMGTLSLPYTAVGTAIVGDVRGQRVPMTVSELPFVSHRYHR